MAEYDPGRVSIIFRGIPLEGFASGTFVNVEREVDAFAKETGARGDVTRVRSRNRSGMVTVTLQAESPSNDLLSAVASLDEQTGLGFGPITVKDMNGTSLHSGSKAWIQKMPNSESADTASTREWVFAVADLTMFVGGALF